MTSDVGLRSERGPILLAVMVATGIVAIDSTILATAVPSIVRDIGGFSQFPWLFSIYLLAQAVTVPIYSKLSDTFGRKPIILVGISIFLLGSILAGFAWSMPALIAFRAIQGLGAGAILPIAVTIVGDIYSLEERARVQGYLASVWAIAAVVGPTLGGVFTQFLSWPWIFFVNIPLCLVAGGLLIRNFHEKVERRSPRIDYAGAVLLTGGLTLVILGLLEGGQAWPWASATSIGIFVGRRGAADDLRARGTSRVRSDPAAVGLHPPSAADHDAARRGGRRRAHRPHLLHPDLPRGGTRHRSADRRPGARRPHDRLAARRDGVGSHLPADRVPHHDHHRHRDHGARGDRDGRDRAHAERRSGSRSSAS